MLQRTSWPGQSAAHAAGRGSATQTPANSRFHSAPLTPLVLSSAAAPKTRRHLRTRADIAQRPHESQRFTLAKTTFARARLGRSPRVRRRRAQRSRAAGAPARRGPRWQPPVRQLLRGAGSSRGGARGDDTCRAGRLLALASAGLWECLTNEGGCRFRRGAARHASRHAKPLRQPASAGAGPGMNPTELAATSPTYSAFPPADLPQGRVLKYFNIAVHIPQRAWPCRPRPHRGAARAAAPVCAAVQVSM